VRRQPAGRIVGQIAFQHQIAASLGYSQEARLGVKAAGNVIGMRHQKPDAPATWNARKPLRNGIQNGAPMAEALMRAANRQPAQPPARSIAWMGMDHVEADQRASEFDTDEGMRRSAPHRLQNQHKRIEKPNDLISVKLNK